MKEKVTISIDADLMKFIAELANKDSRSISSTINKILREYQAQNKNPSTSII